jgi:hypothetical protein
MSTAFVLGNGISRRGLDLTTLKLHGKIYACNGIYREFVPNVLVATDRPISTAIQESGYALKNPFYTRRPVDGLGANTVPKPYFGFSSGPIAVALAAEHGASKIYMLGFDMGPIKNNQINNIYAGTEFYKPQTSVPTFTGNWIKQLTQITKDFPDCEFVRVHGPTTAAITQFDSIKNFKKMDLSGFSLSFNIACQAAK